MFCLGTIRIKRHCACLGETSVPPYGGVGGGGGGDADDKGG